MLKKTTNTLKKLPFGKTIKIQIGITISILLIIIFIVSSIIGTFTNQNTVLTTINKSKSNAQKNVSNIVSKEGNLNNTTKINDNDATNIINNQLENNELNGNSQFIIAQLVANGNKEKVYNVNLDKILSDNEKKELKSIDIDKDKKKEFYINYVKNYVNNIFSQPNIKLLQGLSFSANGEMVIENQEQHKTEEEILSELIDKTEYTDKNENGIFLYKDKEIVKDKIWELIMGQNCDAPDVSEAPDTISGNLKNNLLSTDGMKNLAKAVAWAKNNKLEKTPFITILVASSLGESHLVNYGNKATSSNWGTGPDVGIAQYNTWENDIKETCKYADDSCEYSSDNDSIGIFQIRLLLFSGKDSNYWLGDFADPKTSEERKQTVKEAMKIESQLKWFKPRLPKGWNELSTAQEIADVVIDQVEKPAENLRAKRKKEIVSNWEKIQKAIKQAGGLIIKDNNIPTGCTLGSENAETMTLPNGDLGINESVSILNSVKEGLDSEVHFISDKFAKKGAYGDSKDPISCKGRGSLIDAKGKPIESGNQHSYGGWEYACSCLVQATWSISNRDFGTKLPFVSGNGDSIGTPNGWLKDLNGKDIPKDDKNYLSHYVDYGSKSGNSINLTKIPVGTVFAMSPNHAVLYVGHFNNSPIPLVLTTDFPHLYLSQIKDPSGNGKNYDKTTKFNTKGFFHLYSANAMFSSYSIVGYLIPYSL
jgi:hypothetical protein